MKSLSSSPRPPASAPPAVIAWCGAGSERKISDRLLSWLRLGEVIFNATQPNRPQVRIEPPVRDKFILPSALWAQLADVEKVAAEIPLRHYLQTPPTPDPPQERVKYVVLAAIIWARISGGGYDTMAVHMAARLARLIDKPAPDALLIMRQVFGELSRLGLLIQRESQLYLGNTLTGHLAGIDLAIYDALTPSRSTPSFSRGNSKPASDADRLKAFQLIVKRMEIPRPSELDKAITALGYVAQESARKAVCVAAYRHVHRLREIHIKLRKIESKHDRLLLIGPSGSGKTHLLELVFERALHLPVVIWNSAGITTAGYVGGKVEHILQALVEKADGNLHLAQAGVICLDELDKVAAVGGDQLPGERINRDINGDAQKQLLKVIDGGEISVPTYGLGGDNQWFFRSRDTLVVGAGAFSELRFRRHRAAQIGYGAKETLATGEDQDSIIEKLIRYGFSTEFIGRFTSITQLAALSRYDLRRIVGTVISQHQANLKTEGIDLSVDDSVVDHIVEQAIQRKTGARGLGSCLMEQTLLNALYDAYSDDMTKGITLVMDGDRISHDIIRRKGRPQPKAAVIQATEGSRVYTGATS